MSPALEALLAQLRASHDGEPWYGSPRMQFLRGLSPDRAAAHPITGAHSIWELVLHATAWTREVQRRLMGNAPGEPREGDWTQPGDTSGAAWHAALVSLDDAHDAVVRHVATLSDEDLARPVGNGVTVGEMLVGLAQHDAYHSGQLAILRRALDRAAV
jgi:uncharacterized damage-inducible protein DinB